MKILSLTFFLKLKTNQFNEISLLLTRQQSYHNWSLWFDSIKSIEVVEEEQSPKMYQYHKWYFSCSISLSFYQRLPWFGCKHWRMRKEVPNEVLRTKVEPKILMSLSGKPHILTLEVRPFLEL